MSDDESMQNLKAITEHLQLKLTYPKAVYRLMGVGKAGLGVIEFGTGIFTAETGVGIAVLTTHGVITAESGLRMILSGKEEKTILSLTVSALAVQAGASPKLGNALGVTADTALSTASVAYSFQVKPLGISEGVPLGAVAAAEGDTSLVTQTLEQASYLKAGGTHPEAAIGKGNQVLAGVEDTVTGQRSFSRSTEDVATNLYPALREEYGPWSGLIEGDISYARLGPPGAHGEINALNRALWLRDPTGTALTAADFGSFDMTAVWLGKGGPYVMPRCPTCWFMTPNVNYLGPIGPLKPVF